MPRIGNLLFCSDARTLQYEVRDVHPPVFGTKANKPCFSLADTKVEPLCALLSCCCGWHGSSPVYVHQAPMYVQCTLTSRACQGSPLVVATLHEFMEDRKS